MLDGLDDPTLRHLAQRIDQASALGFELIFPSLLIAAHMDYPH
jgi:hypothetical protein